MPQNSGATPVSPKLIGPLTPRMIKKTSRPLILCSDDQKEIFMTDHRKFYIDGKWISPAESNDFVVVNPATEEPLATISLGTATDVGKAVAAAKTAFAAFSETSVELRLALLRRIIAVYKARSEEMAKAISLEMGAPITLARKAQAPAGLGHLSEAARVLEQFKFEEVKGSTLMRKE